jgi:hypothetical protein
MDFFSHMAVDTDVASAPATAGAVSSTPYPPQSLSPGVSKFAHDAALHFLARPKQYPLTDPASTLTWSQVVEGYTSPHDHDAARRAIERMREHYRRLGQAPRF